MFKLTLQGKAAALQPTEAADILACILGIEWLKCTIVDVKETLS